MPCTWEQITQTLRGRLRRLIVVRGLAWIGLVSVGLLWLVGSLDWLLHLDAWWVRLMLLVGVVAAVAGTIWRSLWKPAAVRLTDVDLARLVERRFPYWKDRLSSAAQFRGENFGQRLGSPSLQQAITSDVEDHLGEIAIEEVVDAQATRRLAVAAVAICLVGISGALWQRSATATALSRLAMPFAHIEWPRETQLQLLDSDLKPMEEGSLRTAAGEPLVLYVENTIGRLPDDVTLELRLPGERSDERTPQSTVLRDESGASHDVAIINLLAHEGPIRFRTVGGDDRQMPWRTLDVVPAPALSDVTTTIVAPAYSHRPPEILTDAGKVEALVGSRIRISAAANTELSRAELRRDGYPPQPMELSDDGRRAETEFLIEQAGLGWYWFDIADTNGLSPGNPPRYELRGISDRKPTAFIEQPLADLTITPDAEIPLRIAVRDDLGVRAVHLIHSVPRATPAWMPLPLLGELPTEETIEITWDLTPLELVGGDTVSFHAEAVDACDLAIPQSQPPGEGLSGDAATISAPSNSFGRTGQVGISAYRQLEVISTDEKRRELAARQAGVLDGLKELQDRQSQALESTAGLRIQSELAERLQDDDVDLLKQTELEQQQIREQIGGTHSAALAQVEELSRELGSNHIDDPQMQTQLHELIDELSALSGELLPEIEQSLARARKLSQSELKRDSAAEAQDQLLQAEQRQTEALARMSELNSRLGSWRKQFEVTSEVDDLIAAQTELQRLTRDIGRETLGKRAGSLTSQQEADLARLSDRQRRLASRLEELLKKPDQQSNSTDELAPRDQAVEEALRRLGERDTTSHMHSAAESLRRNEITGTTDAQQRALDDLRSFDEQLQGGGADAAESLLSRLEEQVEQVETLRKQQTQLAAQAQEVLAEAAAQDNEDELQRLMKRQEELAGQAEELARALRRQQQRQSAQSAARAARRMQDAQQAIEQQQSQQTADAQRDALDDLTQLASELVDRQQQIEQELARQRIEQLGSNLQELADQQEVLLTQTVDLDERQRARGSWSRSLRRELRELTDEQSGLAEQIVEIETEQGDYPVIELALQQVHDSMRFALKLLRADEAGGETIEFQRLAHKRLLALAEAMQQSPGASESSPSSTPPPAGQQPPPGSQQPQAPQLLGTQLRLLRSLQADVQQRTADLISEIGSDNADAGAAVGRREALARDQERIAELARTLLLQFAESSFTDPGEETQ